MRYIWKYCGNCKDYNFLVECSCGCGNVISLRQYRRREKYYRSMVVFKNGHNRGNFKGGYLRSDGYWVVNESLQHRLIIEKELGRKLTALEHIHHINHIRSDNHLENLEVLSNRNHQLLHVRPRDRYGRFIGSTQSTKESETCRAVTKEDK